MGGRHRGRHRRAAPGRQPGTGTEHRELSISQRVLRTGYQPRYWGWGTGRCTAGTGRLVPAAAHLLAGHGYRLQPTGYRLWHTGYHVPYTEYRTPGITHRAPGAGYLELPHSRYWVPRAVHCSTSPCSRHLTASTGTAWQVQHPGDNVACGTGTATSTRCCRPGIAHGQRAPGTAHRAPHIMCQHRHCTPALGTLRSDTRLTAGPALQGCCHSWPEPSCPALSPACHIPVPALSPCSAG